MTNEHILNIILSKKFRKIVIIIITIQGCIDFILQQNQQIKAKHIEKPDMFLFKYFKLFIK